MKIEFLIVFDVKFSILEFKSFIKTEETFIVFDTQIYRGNLYLCGEKTMWFANQLLTRVDK